MDSTDTALRPTTNRMGWIDVARGIGMLLIIVGHVGIINSFKSIAFSVHLPLFLILSGYLYKPGRKHPFQHGVRRLLVPYLASGILISIIKGIIAFITDGGRAGVSALVEWLAATAFASGTRPSYFLGIHFIGAIWFLPALFFVQIIYGRICCKKFALPVIIALFAIGLLSAPYIWLPWSIQASFVSLLFFHLGFESRNRGFSPEKLPAPAVLASLIVWIVAVWLDRGEVYLVSCHFKCLPIDLIGAVAGSIFICWLSMEIDEIGSIAEPLRFMGRNSLSILCFHFIAGRFISWDAIMDALSLGHGRKAFAATMLGELLFTNGMTLICSMNPKLSELFGAVAKKPQDTR